MDIIQNKYLALISILALVCGIIACNPKKVQSETTIADKEETVYDSTKIQIDMAKVDSMVLLYPDSNKPRIIVTDDQATVAESLLTAKYDTAWNDKGIMVKMMAPDYTVIISYKEAGIDDNDFVMMWNNNGRIKFRNKWFLINGDKKLLLSQIFDDYREEE